MFPSLQPSRPRAPAPQSLNPLCQEQIRYTQSTQQQPINQIQAMPPHKTLPATADLPPVYNAAIMHPVFFSDAWRRPPFPMPANHSFSPAATGYVFGERRARTQSMTKL
ncbi:hypothetical protein BDY17DRAFT_322659 [Neohortaea acidophila]|uniref:Uncharacterized protein n=1 Tax=Neohortaea acidophila TaxID=245834 RepID=A0A6A6Q0B3_9PEZI|nr:uncharacterized protein BDY17DRAFT_322659 [Neohortaea acidophila]KAF2485850.1 hypothetical protein BDY17DRAFT_322659 [Neohortaea acidophila]